MSVAAIGSSIGAGVTGLQHSTAVTSAHSGAGTGASAGTSSSSAAVVLEPDKKKPLVSTLAMTSNAVQAAITGLGCC
jgi:hypothetical protein